MATALKSPSNRMDSLLIAGAGIAIIMLSLGAALLPSAKGWSGSYVVAGLLVAAGLIELAAGALRAKGKVLAMLAGGATVVAGLLLAIEPATALYQVTYVIFGWLVTRSLILFNSGLQANGSIRTWTILAAVTDFVLGAIVFTGLAAAAFPIAMFGTTSSMIASFAWILALSLVVTGSYLVGVSGALRKQV